MNLGVVHTLQEDLPASQTYLEQALTVQEAQLGPEHPDLVSTLQNLTVLSSKMGDTAKAVGYMQRAGEIESLTAPKIQ